MLTNKNKLRVCRKTQIALFKTNEMQYAPHWA